MKFPSTALLSNFQLKDTSSDPLFRSSVVANDFNVHVHGWVDDECRIVARVVILSQTRRTVACGAAFEGCGMELSDLLSVCVKKRQCIVGSMRCMGWNILSAVRAMC